MPASRFRYGEPSVGDVVPVRLDPERPSRIRIARARSSDSGNSGSLLLSGGAAIALICGILCWLLGVGVNLSRLMPFRRMA